MHVVALREEVQGRTAAGPAPQGGALVRLLTCGSVDDGKSTLIGRLLWDAAGVTEDQRAAVALASHHRGVNGEKIDFSLLLDGLQAEREQGITIDIAWRYFETNDRRFIIIDSPGHEQYTRNMATGASHADVAILLVDARHGTKRQTRRHAAICDLVGIKKVVLAVNKMDAVDWSEARYRDIEADFRAMAGSFNFAQVSTIPVAALTGDNVVYPSAEMPWYAGPTLLDYLERVDPEAASVAAEAARQDEHEQEDDQQHPDPAAALAHRERDRQPARAEAAAALPAPVLDLAPALAPAPLHRAARHLCRRRCRRRWRWRARTRRRRARSGAFRARCDRGSLSRCDTDRARLRRSSDRQELPGSALSAPTPRRRTSSR